MRPLLAAALLCALAAPGAAAPAPLVAASSAILVDARTGAALYARNAHARRPPASTTKILTALVAVRRLPLDAPIRITRRAELMREGSAIGLTEGETYRFRDLLYALLVHSANDAAIAIAEGVAGSVERFAALMNEEAWSLGARDTHATNPHGLHHREHYSSAHDLALFARAALAYPVVNAAVRTRHHVVEGPGGTRELWGKNRLLGMYRGADGVKTGWVAESGPCLVASATREGWRLISVVLNTGDQYGDTMRLLTYGFQRFERRVAARAGQVLARVPLADRSEGIGAMVEREVTVVVPRGRTEQIHVSPRAGLRAPLRRGTPIGTVTFSLDGRVLASATLVAALPAEPLSWWTRLVQWLRDGGTPVHASQ